MNTFPVHLLVPLPARHWPRRGACQQGAIQIPLRPFECEGERIDTRIRLDAIALDLSDFHALENHSHRFPVNPEDGYIDGCLYLQSRHVPVDVTELAFGALTPEGLPARLAGTLAFAAAGMHTWRDTPIVLSFLLELPPTAAQIDAAVASAIAATRARSLREAGKLMAWLTREHPNWEDRRALHEAVRGQLQALENLP